MSEKIQKKLRRSDSVMQFASELGADQFKKMKFIFAKHADPKGMANSSQLLTILHELNINCSKQEAQTFFQEIDQNGDNLINFIEFIRGLKWIKTVCLKILNLILMFLSQLL